MVNGYTVDKSISRICYACGLDRTTINKKGCPNWILNPPTKLVLCVICYNKIIRIEKLRVSYKRLFSYGSRRKGHSNQWYGWGRVLTGKCSQCSNNIFDGSCKKTHMHHWTYIIICPWYGRVELCVSCHIKQSWLLKQYKSRKGIKHSEETRRKLSIALKGRPKARLNREY